MHIKVDRHEQLVIREEEEEDSEPESITSNLSEEDGGHVEAAVKAASGASETQRAIQVLLENLRLGHAPADESAPIPADSALDLLHDRTALLKAQGSLLIQSRSSSLDVVFRACISAMIGVLNLFLDPELPYTWREASMVVAKAQGHGPTCARSIRTWVLDFVREEKLPLHSHGYTRQTVLEEEEVLQEIQDELSVKSKVGFIKAQDVCEIVASPKLQALFS